MRRRGKDDEIAIGFAISTYKALGFICSIQKSKGILRPMKHSDLSNLAAATIRHALDSCVDPAIEPRDRLVRLLCYAHGLVAVSRPCVPALHRQIADATLSEAKAVLGDLFVPAGSGLPQLAEHFGQLAAFAGGTERVFTEKSEVVDLIGAWRADAEALAAAASRGLAEVATAIGRSPHFAPEDRQRLLGGLSTNRFVSAILQREVTAPVPLAVEEVEESEPACLS